MPAEGNTLRLQGPVALFSRKIVQFDSQSSLQPTRPATTLLTLPPTRHARLSAHEQAERCPRIVVSCAWKDGTQLAQRVERDHSAKGFDVWLGTQRLAEGARENRTANSKVLGGIYVDPTASLRSGLPSPTRARLRPHGAFQREAQVWLRSVIQLELFDTQMATGILGALRI
jgi:hypothetical protein